MACNYTIITPFYSLKTNSKNEYFYFFSRKNKYEQYMVFKYTSSREGGKLNVQALDEDINKLIPIKYEKINSLGSFSSGFFYLEGKSYLSTCSVYLNFQDKGYKLNYNLLQVCFTNSVYYNNCSYLIKIIMCCCCSEKEKAKLEAAEALKHKSNDDPPNSDNNPLVPPEN